MGLRRSPEHPRTRPHDPVGQLQRGGRTGHRLASPFPSGKDKSSFLGCFQTVDVTLETLPKPWLPTGASPHSVATRSDQTPRVHPHSQEKSRGRAVCSLQPPRRCQLSSPQSRRASEGRGWGFCPFSHPTESEDLLRRVQRPMSLSTECLSDGLGLAGGR